MNCLINLLSLCVFDPSGVYLAANAYAIANQEPFAGHWCTDHRCKGPIGELKLGVRVDLTQNFELHYGLRHESFILEKDRGEESAFVGLTWRPFR